MSDLIERLRALSRHEHSDYSIGDEAADALEIAREDEARLDWLAKEAVPFSGGKYELPYFDITSGPECCDPSDLRTAIDQTRGKEVAE